MIYAHYQLVDSDFENLNKEEEKVVAELFSVLGRFKQSDFRITDGSLDLYYVNS